MKLHELQYTEGARKARKRVGRGTSSGNGKTNYTRKEYAIVNLETLNKFEDGATVNAAALKEAGIIKKELDGVKVLGNGAIEKKLTVQAAKFSKSAVAAIEAAGGKTEVI